MGVPVWILVVVMHFGQCSIFPVWTLVAVVHFGQCSCVPSLDTGKLNCCVRILDNAEFYIAVFETV